MNDIIKSIEAEQLKETVDDFRVGDTVKVYAKIKEGNRERVQVFEGTVLKKQGGSVRATFTVRKNSNGIGVEKTWPLHSPSVERVEVVRRGKVRRAKLNYLRQRSRKECKGKRAGKIMNWTWAAARYLRQPFSKVCLKNDSCNLHARFARDFALIRLTQPATTSQLIATKSVHKL